jgi:hypothetical protein
VSYFGFDFGGDLVAVQDQGWHGCRSDSSKCVSTVLRKLWAETNGIRELLFADARKSVARGGVAHAAAWDGFGCCSTLNAGQ